MGIKYYILLLENTFSYYLMILITDPSEEEILINDPNNRHVRYLDPCTLASHKVEEFSD